jgi:hexosaminidase
MKRTNILFFLLLFSALLIAIACAQSDTITDLSKAAVIPKPVSTVPTGNSFSINNRTDIYVQGESEKLLQIGQYLADRLKPVTGFDLEVKSVAKTPGRGDILLAIFENDPELGAEGYELAITDKIVTITACKPAGLFYGVQTLLQLLPAEAEIDSLQKGPWKIPTGTIRDYPSYSYRGAMLDVARHFFTPNEVRTYIDHLAAYKMNVLHLHLSDDQGWRIEIKSWPNLADYGGKTEVGGGEGGFFTQEQYSDIVKYAQERFECKRKGHRVIYRNQCRVQFTEHEVGDNL